MGRKRTCDQNAVLDAFAQKLPLAQISRSMGIPIGTLGAIIHRARKAGDPRAELRRRLRHLTGRPIVKVETARPISARRRRQQLAREFPGSSDELNAAVARANVEVRRLPPGIASWGWRPSWLKI
jgi:predicted nucleic acid-binding protein